MTGYKETRARQEEGERVKEKKRRKKGQNTGGRGRSRWSLRECGRGCRQGLNDPRQQDDHKEEREKGEVVPHCSNRRLEEGQVRRAWQEDTIIFNKTQFIFDLNMDLDMNLYMDLNMDLDMDLLGKRATQNLLEKTRHQLSSLIHL